MKKEEIYKQVYKELKENTNEIIAAYERDEDIDDVIDTIAGNISYKLSERQESTNHSEQHDSKALHIVDDNGKKVNLYEEKETYINNLKSEMNKYYKMDNFLLDDNDILRDKVKLLEKMIIGILNVL